MICGLPEDISVAVLQLEMPRWQQCPVLQEEDIRWLNNLWLTWRHFYCIVLQAEMPTWTNNEIIMTYLKRFLLKCCSWKFQEDWSYLDMTLWLTWTHFCCIVSRQEMPLSPGIPRPHSHWYWTRGSMRYDPMCRTSRSWGRLWQRKTTQLWNKEWQN